MQTNVGITNEISIEVFNYLTYLLVNETENYIKYDIISIVGLLLLIIVPTIFTINILISNKFRKNLFYNKFKTLFPFVIGIYVFLLCFTIHNYTEKHTTEKLIKMSLEKIYYIYKLENPENVKSLTKDEESFLKYSKLISKMYSPKEEFRQKYVNTIIGADITEYYIELQKTNNIIKQ